MQILGTGAEAGPQGLRVPVVGPGPVTMVLAEVTPSWLHLQFASGQPGPAPGPEEAGAGCRGSGPCLCLEQGRLPAPLKPPGPARPGPR